MTLNEVLERIPAKQWPLYSAWLDMKHEAIKQASKRR